MSIGCLSMSNNQMSIEHICCLIVKIHLHNLNRCLCFQGHNYLSMNLNILYICHLLLEHGLGYILNILNYLLHHILDTQFDINVNKNQQSIAYILFYKLNIKLNQQINMFYNFQNMIHNHLLINVNLVNILYMLFHHYIMHILAHMIYIIYLHYHKRIYLSKLSIDLGMLDHILYNLGGIVRALSLCIQYHQQKTNMILHQYIPNILPYISYIAQQQYSKTAHSHNSSIHYYFHLNILSIQAHMEHMQTYWLMKILPYIENMQVPLL